MSIYADDVQVLIITFADELNDLKFKFEASLANLKQRYAINGPQINPDKTECVVITSKHNTSKIDSSFKIVFDGHEIVPDSDGKLGRIIR